MSDEKNGSDLVGRLFNYANNPITIGAIILTTVSGISIVIITIAELAGALHNPYIGLVAYVILPGFFVTGLLVMPVGMTLRRRKLIRAGVSRAERVRYPRLDFNEPRLRRFGTIVIGLTALNAIIFGSSSYLAIEHMETTEFCGTTCHAVMQPEFTAYQESPHSRVACVQCHIGPGASWFVKSKLDGLRQVYRTALNTYDRPIGTPLHTLRPARETCEQCHWPAKHYGDKVRVFARFAADEGNTPTYTRMVLRTGGGSLDLGSHGGIHWWHIYSDNRIRYLSEEDHREEIQWVELTTPDGEVRTYSRPGVELPGEAEIEARARVMDCVDCHNRPTHLFQSPARAIDMALERRPELVSLPFFKRQALAAMEADYPSHAEGVASVRQALQDFYNGSYPELVASHGQLVEDAAEVASRAFSRGIFPEMETDWTTHPNHIGHEESPGCWRCHDDEMATADGAHVINQDCENCHTFPEESDAPPDLGGMLAG